MSFRFTVYGDPISWKRPRANLTKRVFFNDVRHMKYQREIALACKSAMQTLRQQSFLAHVPLLVKISFYFLKPKSSKLLFPTNKKDVDDHAKQIDALNGLLWHDDGQILVLSVRKRWALPDEEPRAVFEVEEITSEA
jgi:Holliday junction resolvase RusA-like endonuclease